MTKEEFRAEMQQIKDNYEEDYEMVHGAMDDLLIKCLRELGYGEGCDIYEDQPKWYA